MKKVLSVIGGFFVSIWRWIKETAWVQPLLIVGIIFGVIFSIPPIVSGINAIRDRNESAETYYRNFQLSLAGAENSAADKFLEEIKANSEGTSTTLAGQKFFLIFVEGGGKCEVCKNARDGLEYLSGEGKILLKNKELNLKTIFVDEELTGKNEKDWQRDDTVAVDNDEKTAFEAFLARNFSKFEDYAGEAQETHFYVNGGISEGQISDLESATRENFRTPTFIQVDFTEGYNGVSNVFIGLPANPDTKLGRAQYLANAWNYEGIFGPNYVA